MSRRSAGVRWVGALLALTAAAAPLVARAEQLAAPVAPATEATATREALLMQHLREPARAAAAERYLGAIAGTAFLGLATAVALADSGEEASSRQKWLSVGIAGGLSAVSFSSYLFGDHARPPVLASLAPLSIAGLGAAFYGSDDASDATRFTFGSMMVTGAVLESLVLVDTALRLPASGRVLERELERMKRPSARLTNDELRDIEFELSLTERPIPRWVSPVVLLGGAVAAATPALASSTTSDDRTVCLVFSSLMAVSATSALVPAAMNAGRGYTGYRVGLRGLGLAPLGPRGSAGFTLAAVF